MKKLILLSVFALVFTVAYTQKPMVVSAFQYTKNGQLDKALTSIEKAIEHPDTKDSPKTWYYRGNVYLKIHMSKEEKYKNLDTNALNKAYDSYKKALELDTKKEYYQELMLALYSCGEQYYNKGIEFYTSKRYEEAMLSFSKTSLINEVFGLVDTSSTYNAALCAELSGKSSVAKDLYKKLITANYQQPLIYTALANIYLDEKDTASAINTIKDGRKIFPSNQDLVTSEANLYLTSGRIKEAKDILELMIEKDPTNSNLYFNVGVVYDNFANDVNQTQGSRENFFNESVKAYKKAIELKPDYFDAIYNLGALYFNEGVRIFQEADKLTDMNKYTELQVQFKKMWTEAQPYLEKALELNGDDQNTLLSLKQLYSRTDQMDKLKAINDKIK